MTTPTKSYRLSTEALRKLERLATYYNRSQAQQLTWLINQAHEGTMDIDLLEDNSGGLYAGNEATGWWLVGDTGSTFAEDATAIAAGDTSDWTLEHIDESPRGHIIAVWRKGETFLGAGMVDGAQPGNAGRRYLGLASK